MFTIGYHLPLTAFFELRDVSCGHPPPDDTPLPFCAECGAAEHKVKAAFEFGAAADAEPVDLTSARIGQLFVVRHSLPLSSQSQIVVGAVFRNDATVSVAQFAELVEGVRQKAAASGLNIGISPGLVDFNV